MSKTALTYEDLKEYEIADLAKMNKIIVELIRVKNRERELRMGAEFSIGDIAKFESTKAGRTIYLKVDTINPKSLVGYELQEDGSVSTNKWRVSPSLCTKTTLADARDAMRPKVTFTPPPAVTSFAEDIDEDEDVRPAAPATPSITEEASDPARDMPMSVAGDAW